MPLKRTPFRGPRRRFRSGIYGTALPPNVIQAAPDADEDGDEDDVAAPVWVFDPASTVSAIAQQQWDEDELDEEPEYWAQWVDPPIAVVADAIGFTAQEDEDSDEEVEVSSQWIDPPAQAQAGIIAAPFAEDEEQDDEEAASASIFDPATTIDAISAAAQEEAEDEDDVDLPSLFIAPLNDFIQSLLEQDEDPETDDDAAFAQFIDEVFAPLPPLAFEDDEPDDEPDFQAQFVDTPVVDVIVGQFDGPEDADDEAESVVQQIIEDVVFVQSQIEAIEDGCDEDDGTDQPPLIIDPRTSGGDGADEFFHHALQAEHHKWLKEESRKKRKPKAKPEPEQKAVEAKTDVADAISDHVVGVTEKVPNHVEQTLAMAPTTPAVTGAGLARDGRVITGPPKMVAAVVPEGDDEALIAFLIQELLDD